MGGFHKHVYRRSLLASPGLISAEQCATPPGLAANGQSMRVWGYACWHRALTGDLTGTQSGDRMPEVEEVHAALAGIIDTSAVQGHFCLFPSMKFSSWGSGFFSFFHERSTKPWPMSIFLFWRISALLLLLKLLKWDKVLAGALLSAVFLPGLGHPRIHQV